MSVGTSLASPEMLMNKPEHFEILKDHAVFRPTGQVSLEQALELVATAVAFARAHVIRKLLIDTSNLTVSEKSSYATQYFFTDDMARVAAGAVRVALVVKPERFDTRKFSTTVAANRGFTVDTFTTEEDALKWLESLK
jgi:hypothetical protein